MEKRTVTRKFEKFGKVFALVILMVLGCLFMHGDASAISATIKNKAFGYGIYQCYLLGELETEVSILDIEDYGDLFTENNFVEVPFINSLYGAVTSLTCKQLFGGAPYGTYGDVFTGLLPAGLRTTSSTSARVGLLAEMAYAPVESTGSCYNLSITQRTTIIETLTEEVPVDTICSSDGNVNAGSIEVVDNGSYWSFVKIDEQERQGRIRMRFQRGGESFAPTVYIDYADVSSFDDLISRVQSELRAAGGAPSDGETCFVREDMVTSERETQCFSLTHALGETVSDSYTIGDSTDEKASSAFVVMDNLLSFSVSSSSGLQFTAEDKEELYTYYLQTVYDLDVQESSDEGSLEDAGYMLISGSAGSCYVHSNNDDTVNGLNSYNHFNGTQLTWRQIVPELGADVVCSLPTTTPSDAPDGEASANSKCSDFKGAGALSWLICPIMQWMQEAALNAYQDYVEPNLIIEPQLFATTSDTGTRQAWGIFRDMANVAFIILFLVVIFSQLTGVGIDNYGIKKILPKMIVAAVLINLSYWLCLIVIDISNIVGSGIFSLLAGLPTPEPTIDGASITPSGATGVAITAVTVLAAVAGIAAVIQNPAMLLTLLVSVVGVLISVFFLFVLLSVREAAIVVLTVVSPIAFVFYMLPNTKKYMDKWWKFLSGLLLVYPIAALLVGGGDYVSRLLLSVNADGTNYMGAFIAMVVGIAPIFFIPTVLKGSFAAFGKVGTTLAGLGTRASGAATKRLSNSGVNKNLQQAGLERQARIRGGLDANGNPTGGVRRAIGTIMSGGKRSRQRNALVYQKMLSDRGSLAAADEKDFMLQTQTANVAKELVASGDINNSAALERGLESALASDDKARIRAYTDALSTKGEDGRKLVKKAYDNAVSNGMSESAAKTFSDNIMANHAADYKNNHRSLFAVVQGINSGSGAVRKTDDYLNQTVYDDAGNVKFSSGRAELASKVTASTIGNMDDEVFDEIFGGGVIPAGMTSDQSEQIGATAYAALNDQNANIKADRRAALENLVAASGYKPKAKTVAFGENSNEMQALTNIETATASSAVNTGAIRRDTRHLESIDISAGRTADNTLRSANTTDQIYGEVQYANQQLGDISDNTELNAVLTDEGNRFAERTANAAERGVDNSEIIIDHTQRAANAAERGNEFAERTANATERGADATETGNRFAERTANATETGNKFAE